MYKISSILGAVIALALGVRAASAQSVITNILSQQAYGKAGNISITVNATGAVTLDRLSTNGYRSGIFTTVES